MKKSVKDAYKVLESYDITVQNIASHLHRSPSEIKDWLGEPNTKKHFALVSRAIMEIVKERYTKRGNL